MNGSANSGELMIEPRFLTHRSSELLTLDYAGLGQSAQYSCYLNDCRESCSDNHQHVSRGLYIQGDIID
jgi:hypothetical protein